MSQLIYTACGFHIRIASSVCIRTSAVNEFIFILKSIMFSVLKNNNQDNMMEYNNALDINEPSDAETNTYIEDVKPIIDNINSGVVMQDPNVNSLVGIPNTGDTANYSNREADNIIKNNIVEKQPEQVVVKMEVDEEIEDENIEFVMGPTFEEGEEQCDL